MESHKELRKKAVEFAAGLPAPGFVRDFGAELRAADVLLETDPRIAACRELILADRDNLGHGLRHALAVARDAVVLVRAEALYDGIAEGYALDQLVLATAVAAVLHDISRSERNHAHAGAEAAAKVLKGLDIPEEHKPRIVTAIRNHEAFKKTVPVDGPIGALISNSLYDADKFRWGPDNFTDTLWLMMESAGGPSLEHLHRRFLQNLEYIRRIKATFRTGTGRRYGPEFIDQGLKIGKGIFRELSLMMGGPRMELITDLSQIEGCCTKKGVVTLGNFDGLHLGHQELVRKVVEKAREINGSSIVFTFHPHPLKVLAPESCPPLLSTYDEKVAMFEELGIDLLLMIPFTGAIAQMTAREFAEKILKDTLNAGEVFVGFNYRFGRGREGNVKVLKSLGQELGFNVTEVREVAFEDEVISSTKIRNLIKAGNVEHAAKLLGRPYAITGMVVAGDRRGRELGFPTANLDPFHEIMPYPGVYAVRVFVEGKQYDGVVNAGFRPTFDKHDLCVEAHLFDFSGNLYGREMTIFFVSKIRDEKRFESLDALVAQIRKDVETAKDILKKAKQ